MDSKRDLLPSPVVRFDEDQQSAGSGGGIIRGSRTVILHTPARKHCSTADFTEMIGRANRRKREADLQGLGGYVHSAEGGDR
jgi:hypothetical protein